MNSGIRIFMDDIEMAKMDYAGTNSRLRGRMDHDYLGDWERRREREKKELKQWAQRFEKPKRPTMPKPSKPKR